jgi:hypothetical protein
MNNLSRVRPAKLPRFLPAFLGSVSLLLAVANAAMAGPDMPANIDNGLRRVLTAESQTSGTTGLTTAKMAKPSKFERSLVRDANRRVMVDIHLNGALPLDSVHAQLTALGANIVAENSAYRHGALCAFLPVDKIAEAARIPGVLSISLTHRPRKNVGATTSGGVFLLHTDTLNAQGIDGTGQTIGVLSDSYDTATTDVFGNPLTIHAAQDIATGDLPGPGNPDNPNPVVVIEEYNPGPDDIPSTDEGRAMLQIVHDVAPKAKLAFATGFIDKIDFANNIRRLRTDANCNVIVDDLSYTEEPMFSDGIIAQAVDDIVNSTTLDGPKGAYFSSAGNAQGGGYLADFNPIPDATARAGVPNQNLKLEQVPAALTSGGFHNFNSDPSGPVRISQTFIIPAQDAVDFSFQWNDPFDQTPPNGVTTDYNILVFDVDGNFLPDVSGTSDNFSTQEGIDEILVGNDTDSDVRYQIALTRAGTMPATPVANKLRYQAIDDFGSGIGAENDYQPKAPSTYGHNCAEGAVGVAAYVYTDTPTNPVAPPFFPFIEDFSSPGGPLLIYFDSNGNRLATPQMRLKPEVAGPDGVNTTFFGEDYEGDGFPNFFGTSAAAPHLAGVAALLLQKAGGPESLTVPQLKTALETTVTMQHDLDPFFSQAVVQQAARSRRTRKFSGATVTLSGCGNSSNASAHDTNFFTLTFSSVKRRESLKSITIDLTNADLKFDTTAATGFPLTLGRLVNISPSDIIVSAPPETETLPSITLTFLNGAFRNGTSITFGIDRDFIGDGGGNTGDYLEGGVVSATTNINNLKGVFVNTYGFGFSEADGFGLIDAVQAVQSVNPPSPAANGVK